VSPGGAEAEVVVAGGGVAGSALAILLGRAGRQVTLFEQHRFPREKACAEGIMPAGVGVLDRLGLLPAIAGAPLAGIRYRSRDASGERQVEALFPPGPRAPAHGLAQRRSVLDTRLLETARRTPGVTVHEGQGVDGPLIEHGRVRGVVVAGQPCRAALVVAADGPRSVLRRRVDLDPPAPRRPRIGVRRHFRLAPGQGAPSHVEIFLAEGHELYLTPLPTGEISLALLAEREDFDRKADTYFQRAAARIPRLRALLEGAEPVSELAGRTPLAARARRGWMPGLVLLGDAAAALDPVTGAGMAQALVSAELLADRLGRPGPLEPGDDVLAEFDRQRQALYREAALLSKLVLSLVRSPRLTRGAIHLLHHVPSLFTHLVGVAAGTRHLLPV
jgi:2-polyprenyl-6-methoxyphenol hydroxylase-like FAD-dependent oxidoreductase